MYNDFTGPSVLKSELSSTDYHANIITVLLYLWGVLIEVYIPGVYYDCMNERLDLTHST